MSETNRDKVTIKKLKARIALLESVLKCAECGHLRHEHDDDDAPCYGGREGMETGEGPYCMCNGFRTAEASHD